MPLINGFELYRLIKERSPKIPVVVVTRFSEDKQWENLNTNRVRHRPFLAVLWSDEASDLIGLPNSLSVKSPRPCSTSRQWCSLCSLHRFLVALWRFADPLHRYGEVELLALGQVESG